MADTFVPPAVLTVVVRERQVSSRMSFLDIEYDASQPPADLFAELRRLGWEGAVPTSPKASQIDWDRPDPERGTPYSVLPHLAVVTCAIQGAAAHCADVRQATQAVLARLGFDGAGDGANGGAAGGLGPSSDRDPSAVAGELVEVVCSPVAVAGAEEVLDGFGEVLGRQDGTEEVVSTWRGNVSSTLVPVCRVRATVDGARFDELVGCLSAVGVRAVERLR